MTVNNLFYLHWKYYKKIQCHNKDFRIAKLLSCFRCTVILALRKENKKCIILFVENLPDSWVFLFYYLWGLDHWTKKMGLVKSKVCLHILYSAIKELLQLSSFFLLFETQQKRVSWDTQYQVIKVINVELWGYIYFSISFQILRILFECN